MERRRTGQAALVPFPVSLNVLLVAQTKLLQGLDDVGVPALLTHLLGGEVGVATAVCFLGVGGWVGGWCRCIEGEKAV